jgi:hypothetical protein
MSQNTLPTSLAGARELGLIGARQLHAVQVIDIGRLTTHVVPFVPGTFVAITGRGPKGDSNESGKTTFLAGTALLLGDPEWKLASGGQHTYSLLFNPRAVGAADERIDAADHGYIVGLFADAGEPPTAALTVWMRINRASPYIEVKAALGEHFIDPAAQPAASLAADAHWARMANGAGQRPLGARTYVEALYGTSPRCIAHLTKRGDLGSGPSLLNTAAGAFSREQIGEALVTLAGRRDILEHDREQRSALIEAEHDLDEGRRHQIQQERDYTEQLDEIDGREAARERLAVARQAWDTHNARRLIDAVDALAEREGQLQVALVEQTELEQALSRAQADMADLADDTELHDRHAATEQVVHASREAHQEALRARLGAERALETTRDRARELDLLADGYDGAPPEQTQLTLARAEGDLTGATAAVAVLAARAQDAHAHLARAQEGREDAGDTLQALAAASIPAVGLLDSIELDPTDKRLEPLIWPYRDGVVLAAEQLEAAVEALREQPWAVLISGPAGPLPDGVAACPPAASRFLSELAERAQMDDDPPRVSDRQLGVTIVSGSEPIAGRAARVRAAERAVERAEQDERAARDQQHHKRLLVDQAASEHARALAATDLRDARGAQAAAERELDRYLGVEQAADRDRDHAEETERELALKVNGLELARQAATRELERAAAAVNEHGTLLPGLHSEVRASRDAAETASVDWGRGEPEARARCAEDPRDAGGLRNRANEALKDAVRDIGMRAGQDNAPTEELLQAWRKRGDESLPFPELAGPLGRHLDEFAERDLVLREQIAQAREHVEVTLDAAEIDVANTRTTLGRIQDAIQSDIETAIAAIEDQFNQLDAEAGGHGAKLELTIRPPIDPRDEWEWSVTPMWRRSPGARMVPYTAPTNSAQDKLYTVNLVLAALLAVPHPEGRVLVLDELGDSLGFQHRRDVLRAIAHTAREKGITVLGTCQDDVLHHAADFTQEIVFFEYSDHRHLLNRPVRLFGFDPNGERVEMNREAVLAGRPVV